MSEIIDSILASLVGLKMPCALEALDHTMLCLERGEMPALEARLDIAFKLGTCPELTVENIKNS